MHSSGSQSGFSLIETMVAMCVLTVGAVGMASVFMYGMQSTISSPNEVVAAQKAQEVVEGVFEPDRVVVLERGRVSSVRQTREFVRSQEEGTTVHLTVAGNSVARRPPAFLR